MADATDQVAVTYTGGARFRGWGEPPLSGLAKAFSGRIILWLTTMRYDHLLAISSAQRIRIKGKCRLKLLRINGQDVGGFAFVFVRPDMDMTFQRYVAAHGGVKIKLFKRIDLIFTCGQQSVMTGQVGWMKERHRAMGCAGNAHDHGSFEQPARRDAIY